MSILVKTDSGRLVESQHHQLVEHLWRARQTQPFWDVVEEVIKTFRKREPEKWNAYIIRGKELKRAQKTTWVGKSQFRGVSKDRKNDALLSLVVDFPIWIHLCLKRLYPEKSNYLNGKKFFRGFAARFPAFRIREKV